jgi:hypothetical protein
LAVVRLALVALARPRPKQTQLNRQSTGKVSVLFYWVKGGYEMPRGRPKKVIDLGAVEELAAEGNTQADIADALDFARGNFLNRKDVRAAYVRGVSQMRLRLRHWQVQAAKGGNIQMLIWLGRQYLGQSDTPAPMESDNDNGVQPLVDMLMKPAPDRDIKDFEDG